MSYAWVITHDYIGENLVGTIGPSGTTETHDSILLHTEARPFRMIDADNEVYCLGWGVGCVDDFQPLDDFGRPSLGAVTIQWLTAGKWSTV